MTGRKREHLNEVIRQKLSTILLQEANDPRFAQVTITGVALSRDRSFAKVSVSSFATNVNEDALIESLNQAAGFFSRAIGRTLETRQTPRLAFVYDHGYDHAQTVDALLKRIEEEDSS